MQLLKNSFILGFAPDVKVWEVILTKAGEYQEVKKVFALTGHTSGVYDVAFDVDSSHMATVSKDGTWKLFDIKGNYFNLKLTHSSNQFFLNLLLRLKLVP